MTVPGLIPDVAVQKNHTNHTITTDTAKKVEGSKGGNLIALICMLVLALLTAVMIGGFLVTPFLPEGIYIGITALASLLVGMVLFPIVMSCLSKPPASVRPRDLDLSKLDTRHNRLLHEIIKDDEKKYAQEQEEKVRRRRRKTVRARPQQTRVQDTSSDETLQPRRKSSAVLNLIRPKSSSPRASSNLSSSDSNSDSDSSGSRTQPNAITKPCLPSKYNDYFNCVD
ncbi:DUF456 domain-containing protein [Chlamydia crocodili]|uniref:DUF456 domain-containing protein n=1 Tax=Chlamydia crocodili TaxID=2766982 RepID=A0ABX8CCY4_9CHLA|nr:DUF456 domain-containing protein [Chlamydia crocodili]QVE48870.1 DUF456 domain-containing protein [Chlamydia crocodili]